MDDLDIRFIPLADLTPELQREFDELDRLAFGGIIFEEDPDFPPIQWAVPGWMALGFLQGQLITQLCIPKREITVGTKRVWVAGVGGMATHPKFQHQGLGSLLLAATESFMRDTIRVPFGLLICPRRFVHSMSFPAGRLPLIFSISGRINSAGGWRPVS